MDDVTEERASNARARSKKHAQDTKVPFLIRDDGMLYPNTPLVRRNPRFRFYYGDPKASLSDRMRFLAGLSKKRDVIYNPEPDEPFDIGKAGVDELLAFAVEQFGRVLDPNKPLKALREEVFALSQLPDVVPGVASALDDDDAATARAAALAQKAADEAGSAPAAVIGLGQPPAGHAIETPPPTRGGRQPRGTNTGAARAAGTRAAEAA